MTSVLRDLNLDWRLLVGAVIVIAQATALIGVALVLSRASRRNAAQRHGIWLCALIAVLASPAVVWIADRLNVSSLDLRPQSAMLGLPEVDHFTAAEQAGMRHPFGAPSAEQPKTLQESSAGRRAQHMSAVPAASAPSAANGPSEWLYASGLLLVVVWLAGVVVGLVRLFGGWCAVCALRHSFQRVDESALNGLLDEIRRMMPCDRLPAFAISDRVRSPAAIGLLRPCVVLPRSFAASLRRDELRQILVHECAHVVRRDHVVALLQKLAAILYWPHPLVHGMNRELARAREEVCDNYVLHADDRHSYARTLLHVSEQITPARPAAVCGLLGAHWSLKERITGLLDEKRVPMLRIGRWKLTGLFVSLVGVSLLIGAARVLNQSHASAVAQIKQSGGHVSEPGSPQNRQLEALGGEATDFTRVIIPYNWKGGPKGLEHLQDVDGLEELWLSGTPPEVRLEGLTDLKRLIFNTNYWHEETQRQIMIDRLPLSSLELSNLPKVEELDLTKTSLERLRLEGMPGLKSLNLGGTAACNDATLTSLPEAPNLEKLTAGSSDPLQNAAIADAGARHLARLGRLRELDLTGAQLTDTGVEHLSGLVNLEMLMLSGPRVTDAGIASLVKLQRLRLLSVAGTGLTDDGLARLAGLRDLRTLLIAETAVSPAGLQHLQKFPALAWLNIDSRQLTAQGSDILNGLPELRILWIMGHTPDKASIRRLDRITFLGLHRTQSIEFTPGSLPNLNMLILSGVSRQVTDSVLRQLGDLPALTSLELRNGWLPTGELDRGAGLNMSDEKMRFLARASRLKELKLAGAQIGDDGVAHLSALTELVWLDLRATAVSDAGLKSLAGLKNLRTLILRQTRVTAAGLQQLQQELPETRIDPAPEYFGTAGF